MNSETAELILEAARTLLHREIKEHGHVTLTPQDFAEAEAARDRGQAIQLTTDGTNVTFTHAKSEGGKPLA